MIASSSMAAAGGFARVTLGNNLGASTQSTGFKLYYFKAQASRRPGVVR